MKGLHDNAIQSFRGEYDYLSNFYPAPVEYKGLWYLNNEAAFQAQKCLSEEEKQPFTQLEPGKAKPIWERSSWLYESSCGRDAIKEKRQ